MCVCKMRSMWSASGERCGCGGGEGFRSFDQPICLWTINVTFSRMQTSFFAIVVHNRKHDVFPLKLGNVTSRDVPNGHVTFSCHTSFSIHVSLQ